MLDLIKLQVSPPSSKQGRETSSARSARAEVRNPILALPAAARLAELSEKERETLIAILLDIKTDATDRANVCWKKHKAPMAAYWKAVSVYSGHIVRAIRRSRSEEHTSELQSLMRISYAVFRLKKTKHMTTYITINCQIH